jgi:hypothetical protein
MKPANVISVSILFLLLGGYYLYNRTRPGPAIAVTIAF